MNKKPEILKTKTSLEQSIVTSMRCAVADLEGLLPLIDEADERYIPVHSTINDLKIGIVRLSGN